MRIFGLLYFAFSIVTSTLLVWALFAYFYHDRNPFDVWENGREAAFEYWFDDGPWPGGEDKPYALYGSSDRGNTILHWKDYYHLEWCQAELRERRIDGDKDGWIFACGEKGWHESDWHEKRKRLRSLTE